MHIITTTVDTRTETSHTPIQETAVGTLLGYVAKRNYRTNVGIRKAASAHSIAVYSRSQLPSSRFYRVSVLQDSPSRTNN